MFSLAKSRVEPKGAAPFKEHAPAECLAIGPAGAGTPAVHAASSKRAFPEDSQAGPFHDEYGPAHAGATATAIIRSAIVIATTEATGGWV
jgi:hypothetical protein